MNFILVIERVPKGYTRTIPGKAGLSYEEILHQLHLYLCRFRRIQENISETHKILAGLSKLDAERTSTLVMGPEHDITI